MADYDPATAAPCHLVAQPGDSRSLCGIKDPLPRAWAEKVQMHIDGYGLVVCAGCEQVWRQRAALPVPTLFDEVAP